MADPVIYFCAALLLATFIIVLVLLVGVRQLVREKLSPEAMAHAMRGECDLVRRDAEAHARAARGELVHSFGVLSQNIESRVNAFGGRLGEGMASMNGRVDAIAQKLDRDIAQMADDAVRGREGLRETVEGRLQDHAAAQDLRAKTLREEVGANVRTFGGQMAATLADMGLQQKERLEHNERAVRMLAEQNVTTQEALRKTVEGRLDILRQENSAKLDEMRKTVDEKLQSTLEARLGESFTRVVEQLNRVHEGLGEMKSLAANVGDLKSVLTNVKVRGIYGEAQLALILEQFLAPHQFVKDARVKEGSLERVEFAVRFPGRGEGAEVLLPIDAKFPRETFERLMEASQNGQVDATLQLRKELDAQIRKCAKDIREKYIAPPTTTDFAVMFLPTESLYAEVLRQPGLFEVLQRDYKVTVAGPTTLSALLGALQIGFRTLAIEKRSSEVWQILGAVKNEFGKYNGVVEGLAKQLDTAMRSVEKLGTRTKVLTRTLKNVHDLPDAPAAALLDLDSDEGEASLKPLAVERSGPKLLFSDTAA